MLVVFGWDYRDTVRIYPKVDSHDRINGQGQVDLAAQISVNNDAVIRSGDSKLFKRWKTSFLEDFLQLIDLSKLEESKPLIFSGSSFVVAFLGDQTSVDKSILYCEFSGSCLPQPVKFPKIVSSVACGSSHALLLAEDGIVFSIGRGRYGELGLGDNTLSTETRPRQVDLPPSERAFYIAAGTNHSAVLTEPYGYLYTFGCGSHYRLGHDTDDNVYTPKRVEALVGVGDFNESAIPMGIKLVGCGTWHTIAVAKGSNDVFGMGWNKFGQLGTSVDPSGKHIERIINYPERISQLDDKTLLGDDNADVIAVSCGSKISSLLTASQRLIIMGELGSGPVQGVDDAAIFNLYDSSVITGDTNNEEDGYQTIQLMKGLFSTLHPRVIEVDEFKGVAESFRSSKKRDYEDMMRELPEPLTRSIVRVTANESYLTIDIR